MAWSPGNSRRKVGRVDEASTNSWLCSREESLPTASSDRAVCFTQFAEWGGRLQARLCEALGVVVPFHSGVAKAGRDAMVARFRAGTARLSSSCP